jgi:hypothetical protein
MGAARDTSGRDENSYKILVKKILKEQTTWEA